MDLLGQYEDGTTNIVLPLERGTLVATCSRLTTREGLLVIENAMKFRLVTSSIGVVMSGLYERFETIHCHLLNWVSNNSIPPPTVYMVAKAAQDYMSVYKATGEYTVSLLFVGHDYVDNSLVHSIICVADEPAPPLTPCPRVNFDIKRENFIIAGSGEKFARIVLDRFWTDKLSAPFAYSVAKLSLLEPALKDPKTGGILRFFYMSPLCRTLPMSDVYDAYIEFFDEHRVANEKAIFIMCIDGHADSLLNFKFRHYGPILYQQCLSKRGQNSFHRIEYTSPKSVQQAISESTNVQTAHEPFCYFQSIRVIAPNGYISDMYISTVEKLVLQKVKDYMGPVAYDSNP